MRQAIVNWIIHSLKPLYPVLSLASLTLFFFDSSVDNNAYWIEVLKYTFGIIGSLALVIFTFYYRKMLEIKTDSENRDKELREIFDGFCEKFEVKVEKRILLTELTMKDKNTATDLDITTERITRNKEVKQLTACVLLLREAISTGDKDNLDLRLFLKD